MDIKKLFSRKKIIKAQSINSQIGFNGSKFPNAIPYQFTDYQEELDYDQIRLTARKQYTENTIAHTAIETKVNTAINSGLNIEAKPNKRILKKYNVEVDPEWSKDTEAQFDAWASSKGADYNFQNNFYQLQNIAFRQHLIDGEFIAIPRLIPNNKRGRLGRLNIQLLKIDKLANPINYSEITKAGHTVISGKRIDKTGTIIGYYVKNDKEPLKPTYIPRWGERSGRINVINPIRSNSINSVNGVSDLVCVLHDLISIEKYRVAELEAAVVNATIALIQNSDGVNTNPSMLRNGVSKRSETRVDDAGTEYQAPIVDIPQPGMHVTASRVGQKLESYDTKRPNVNYEKFKNAICQSISASMGIPIEILEKKFSSNYSASRAALLEYWRYVTAERKNFAWDFCQPIYELWLEDEISFSRINCKDWNKSDLSLRNIIRKAWAGAEWHGVAKGNIDPLKEMKAAAFAEDRGYTTAERNSRELYGMNFDNNLERRLTEVDEQRKIAVGNPQDYLIDGETEGAENENN